MPFASLSIEKENLLQIILGNAHSTPIESLILRHQNSRFSHLGSTSQISKSPHLDNVVEWQSVIIGVTEPVLTKGGGDA